MNRQLSRLAMAAIALLVALIAGTTYWQTWAAASLADRQDNEIQRVAEFTVKRGLIWVADPRTAVAANVPRRVGGQTLYFRRYPAGPLVADVVGYSTQTRSQAGLERSMNDYLTGANANLSTALKTTFDRLRGFTVKGNSLELTLDLRAQRIAAQQLQGKCGAAVALEPATGKVLVMTTAPTYDPNLVERDFRRIGQIKGPCSPAAPLLNRATEGLFTPGSSFKVVTSAAALDSGIYTPDSTFVDRGYCIEYGKQVKNFGDQNGPEVFGQVNFTQALQHSINAVFCEIGKRIGPARILEYAKRFGFYSVPPLETPVNERAASGLYDHGKLFDPKPKDAQFKVDPGRLAFGQERMLTTPLQMAMVAAGVANGGVVMRPYVVDRILAPDGSIVSRTRPSKLGRAVKPQVAAELNQMMQAVVSAGTGTAAQLPGVKVAGKTGTAETGVQHVNTTWFICFAPADNPRVAVAVVLENQHGTGGTTAAPIAKAIMQALLQRGSNS